MKLDESILFEIPEIKKYSLEYRTTKRQLNRKRQKLLKLIEYYTFIEDIISNNIDDIELEFSVFRLFKSLGFKVSKPKSTRDIDVIVKTATNLIGIEVKNSSLPAENELFQAKKYTERHKDSGKLMHPIIVWNNAKTNQNFDSYRIKDAKLNYYGLLTTRELLKGFMKIKKGKLTIKNFTKIINSNGLIVFSNKAIENLDRSVSV
ncbi:MAG: hypothetical protein GXO79_10990 [Chlorobi bacterium]|nr:hypothetical protein [Chlorobiota bacterium]